ncbi:MAG TPA: secretin N-terminal domain-containing protein, partial [Kiritimatiellia bacterium]|nr:secretin N-terminal domain-containing protein [Kiritimatiellia bacterium]
MREKPPEPQKPKPPPVAPVTEEDWKKAKALLAVNGFTQSRHPGSGETRTLVMINRTSYTVGDTLSLTNANIHFTWDIESLAGLTLKLKPVRANRLPPPLSLPTNTKQEYPMKGFNLVCLSFIAVAWHTVHAQEANAQPPAAAQPETVTVRVVNTPANAEPLVSMAFDETPLTDVIKAFRDATGANIISGGTNLQGVVSVRLDNVPWRKGLSSILDPQGLQLAEEPAGSGIFIVKAKSDVIPKVTRTFELKHARADEVTNLVVSAFGRDALGKPMVSAVAYNVGNVVIVTATEQQITECKTMIETIDKPSPQVYIEVRFVELNAAASRQLGMKWNQLKEWGAGVHDINAGMEYNRGKLAAYKTGGSEVRDSSAILPGTGVTDSEGTFIAPVYGKETVQTILTPTEIPAAAITSEGLTKGAGRSAQDMMWKQARGIGGQLSVDGFRLALSAFEQMDGVSIFSNPKIIVANEKEAVVDMTTKLPNLTMTTSRTGTQQDQLDISARLEVIPGDKGDKDGKGRGLFAGEAFFSWGISVKVTPRISSSGLITMVVEPSISALNSETPYYVFAGVGSDTPTPQFPIIDMQRMQTVFTMLDGSTAVIGGLTRTTEGSIDSGI